MSSGSYKTFFRHASGKNFFSSFSNNKFQCNFLNSNINSNSMKGFLTHNFILQRMVFLSNSSSAISSFRFNRNLPVETDESNQMISAISGNTVTEVDNSLGALGNFLFIGTAKGKFILNY